VWELRKESRDLLDLRLAELKPRLVAEAGSGESTAILARHAPTVSLEHIGQYADYSRRIAPTADVRLCRLKKFHTLAGTFKWYDTQLPDGIDFVLIDGPPLSVGREAALFAFWPYLSDRWEIWLDDADRPHEKACLKLWAEHFKFEVEPINRWMVRLTSHSGGRVLVDG
jgi:hypothetical protein